MLTCSMMMYGEPNSSRNKLGMLIFHGFLSGLVSLRVVQIQLDIFVCLRQMKLSDISNVVHFATTNTVVELLNYFNH